MSAPTIATPYAASRVIWQESDDEGTVPEPALLLDAYADDLFGITQEGRTINVNGATLAALFKALRELREEARK
jgi:hypothetical protein